MSQYSRIIGRRTLKPILWNLLFQLTFLSLFVFINSASLFHPFQWIYDWYESFLWQGSWLYFLPLSLMVILLASASTEDYLKIQPFYPNRISLLFQAVKLHYLLIGGLNICIGYLIPWAYTSVIGAEYDKFTYTCKYSPNDTCLSEKRLFLIFGGMWVSLLHFIHSHFFGTRYLKFPIAQLRKFVLIKSHFIDTFRNAAKWIIIPVTTFIVIYYLKLGSIATGISESFNYKIEEERLDSLLGLFNIMLLLYLVVFSIAITATVRLMEMFSRVYLTERFIFPFHPIPDSEIPVLTDALKATDSPIIQHLAFLDLMLLSGHSKTRRGEIFKLSSFGGHPHLWKAVRDSCYDIVLQLIEDLDETLSTPMKKINGESEKKAILRRNVTDYFAGCKTPVSPSLDTTRNLSQTQLPQDDLLTLLNKKIMSVSLVVFMFGYRRDMKIRHSLRLSLPVKWASESLSFLASHSVDEDGYGVLVTDLPDIIKLLLHLKQALNNLIKRSSLGPALSRQDVENICQATALKKSVKRSIYRIVNSFKNYLSDLPLEREVECQLMPFISYRD